MIDPIDTALVNIQLRCKVSWSENEIIGLIEDVRKMRKAERQLILRIPVKTKKETEK